ncbi:MAG: hypothetical protein IJR99_03170 [Kiritimatiellae bacterium]|nr:hypothetical protein [Kiritimatiellia bacterium]
MKKLMIMTFAAIVSAVVFAQKFGGEKEAPSAVTPETVEAIKALPPPTGQGAGVAQMQQALAEEIAPAQTAQQAIEDYLNTKEEWNKGYDEENDRIIVTASIEFDIKNPEVSTDFVKLRGEKISELLLMAKGKIIENIMSTMSGERILNIPGNPIAKQVEKELQETNKQIEAARKTLARLDKSLAEALERRDEITVSELVAVISSWFINAEKNNLAAKYDADKKELYANVKADFEEAQKVYDQLLKKAEQLKGTISRELKTSLSRVAAMPIYGCTVLQQAESITEKNGRFKYQIAIAYAWSGEMQKASGEILRGDSVKFTPGKKSIKQWIAGKVKSGALSQWCGPRQYIDDKGNMWFLGIACAPTLDDADDNNDARGAAELEAAAEVIFSLFSDVDSSRTLEKLSQTKMLADASKAATVYQAYRNKIGERFKDIVISGNGELYSGTLRHAPSGLDLQVVIYGVNSGSIKALKDIQTRATALGIEVNTYQEMERGRQDQMNRALNASKNNATARTVGTAQANTDLKAEASQAAQRRAARQQSSGFTEAKGTQPEVKTTGKLRKGTAIITDDDD